MRGVCSSGLSQANGSATYQNNLAKKLKELLPPEEDLKNLIHSSEDDTEKKM